MCYLLNFLFNLYIFYYLFWILLCWFFYSLCRNGRMECVPEERGTFLFFYFLFALFHQSFYPLFTFTSIFPGKKCFHEGQHSSTFLRGSALSGLNAGQIWTSDTHAQRKRETWGLEIANSTFFFFFSLVFLTFFQTFSNDIKKTSVQYSGGCIINMFPFLFYNSIHFNHLDWTGCLLTLIPFDNC